MNRDEDEIDTAPVVMADKTDVVFKSLDLEINEKDKIVLAPDKPMRCPTLFMSCYGNGILIEDIYHGRTTIARQKHWPIELFKMGHQLNVTVTKDEPIGITIVNLGPERSKVGASLVASPPKEITMKKKETP